MIANNLTLKTIVIDEVSEPLLKAIDVLAEGDLEIEDIEGNSATYTFDITTLNTPLPYRLEMRIRKVISTGTTIAVENLIGLH